MLRVEVGWCPGKGCPNLLKSMACGARLDKLVPLFFGCLR